MKTYTITQEHKERLSNLVNEFLADVDGFEKANLINDALEDLDNLPEVWEGWKDDRKDSDVLESMPEWLRELCLLDGIRTPYKYKIYLEDKLSETLPEDTNVVASVFPSNGAHRLFTYFEMRAMKLALLHNINPYCRKGE